MRQKYDWKNRVRKWRVVGRIYGKKYSWKGHNDRHRHKNRIKRSGQARLVYAKHINCNIPTTWRFAHEDKCSGIKHASVTVPTCLKEFPGNILEFYLPYQINIVIDFTGKTALDVCFFALASRQKVPSTSKVINPSMTEKNNYNPSDQTVVEGVMRCVSSARTDWLIAVCQSKLGGTLIVCCKVKQSHIEHTLPPPLRSSLTTSIPVERA